MAFVIEDGVRIGQKEGSVLERTQAGIGGYWYWHILHLVRGRYVHTSERLLFSEVMNSYEQKKKLSYMTRRGTG